MVKCFFVWLNSLSAKTQKHAIRPILGVGLDKGLMALTTLFFRVLWYFMDGSWVMFWCISLSRPNCEFDTKIVAWFLGVAVLQNKVVNAEPSALNLSAFKTLLGNAWKARPMSF